MYCCSHTPGAYPLKGIVTVGATTRTGAVADFSNWGAQSVDVFAHGVSVTSLDTTVDGDRYINLQGTSLSAPLVTGAVAYVWSISPEATRDQVIAAILAGARKSPQLTGESSAVGN
eukprot:GHVU01213139.1.p1 GENE.GHVU01213139.1~~GHVU01213139.1.p1  ORF type:complete len:116 (-),score=2.60 GHVU01213139.1:34-381(-)